MRNWLTERQAAGASRVNASLVGTADLHDRWNGRHGDIAFVLSTLGIAAELGFRLDPQLFVIKSSLPHLAQFVERIDALPSDKVTLDFRPFYHVGHGVHHEREPIDERDRDNLPPQVFASVSSSWSFQSEREWLRRIQRNPGVAREITCKLKLTPDNVDRSKPESRKPCLMNSQRRR